MTTIPDVHAPRVPETSTYHGVEVTEDYRWLEDSSSEETLAWTSQQQARTCAYLDTIPCPRGGCCAFTKPGADDMHCAKS